jgi:hypothetical protein
MPTEDELRQFLLGALTQERVEAVRIWLEADPTNAVRLAAIVLPAEFATEVDNRAEEEPAPADARLAQKDRKAKRRLALYAAGLGLLVPILVGVWLGTSIRPAEVAKEPALPKAATPPANYRGRVDVLVERSQDGQPRLLQLDRPGALPLTANDQFRIEGEVDPPAYLYLVWVDPDHDVTPVYPWNPAAERWQGTRPALEEPTGRVSLPPNEADRWTAQSAKPGIATMVLFARSTPLDATDEVLEGWFKELPELPLPHGGNGSAMWFDDYGVVSADPSRRRGFAIEPSNDPFERWQGQLQRSLGGRAQFETAVSFARTGRK